MATELLPFMCSPPAKQRPRSLRRLAAEGSARATPDLSLRVASLLVARIGYVYRGEPDDENQGFNLRLQCPELASADVARAELIAPNADFSIEIEASKALHVYSGSASSAEPQTARFDFPRFAFGPKITGDKFLDAPAQSRAIENVKNINPGYVLVGEVEAEGLMNYLENGHPIRRLE